MIILKRRFLFTFVFPSLYIIAVLLLSGPFGGAGHGWGVGMFFNISLPAGLLGFLIVEIIPIEGILVPIVFLAALAQYLLLGFLVDKLGRYKRGKYGTDT